MTNLDARAKRRARTLLVASSATYFILAAMLVAIGLVKQDSLNLPGTNAPWTTHAYFMFLLAFPLVSVCSLFWGWNCYWTGKFHVVPWPAAIPWLYFTVVICITAAR